MYYNEVKNAISIIVKYYKSGKQIHTDVLIATTVLNGQSRAVTFAIRYFVHYICA